MSVSFALRSRIVAGLVFSLLLVASIAPYRSAAFAESATTTSQSEGAASAVGAGGGAASVTTTNSSNAQSTGNNSAAASSNAGVESSAQQGNYSYAVVGLSASASASANGNSLQASATASAQSGAGATGSELIAAVVGGNAGLAYARSSRRQTTAYAASANGGYALAVGGNGASATAFVPDGITTTSNRGRRVVSISYTDLGSYSIAISNGRRAHAVTGTTENIAALAAGRVRAIISSGMKAEAYSDSRNAYASAYAQARSFAENAAGRSRASGYAYAAASVTRTNNKITITIVSSKSSWGCGGDYKSVSKKKRIVRDCRIEKRTISLAGKARNPGKKRKARG